MEVGFKGCGNQVLTFLTDEDIAPGTPVAPVAPGKVAPAATGEPFMGIALHTRGGCVSVVVSGVVTVPFRGTGIEAGYIDLTPDGNGKITQGTDSFYKFVIDVDAVNKQLTMIL